MISCYELCNNCLLYDSTHCCQSSRAPQSVYPILWALVYTISNHHKHCTMYEITTLKKKSVFEALDFFAATFAFIPVPKINIDSS